MKTLIQISLLLLFVSFVLDVFSLYLGGYTPTGIVLRFSALMFSMWAVFILMVAVL